MTDTPRAAPPSAHLKRSDLLGVSQLAVSATLGLTSLVENLHHNILRAPGPLGMHSTQPTRGITGLVYRSVRGVTRMVGGSLELMLGQLSTLLGPDQPLASGEREAVLAALNGVLGDHLAATANPLAIHMHLRHLGCAVTEPPDNRVLLMVHGLCMNAGQWRRNGHDHGAALAAEMGHAPLYLQYNTGLHISTNGLLLADQLRTLDAAEPLTDLVILGHSMGGLVARSAFEQALLRGDRWPQRLSKLVCLGSPHHGASLERGGHWIDVILGASPYSAAFARLGQLRSAGITDLRHGNLLDADWADGSRFAHARDTRTPVPLPEGVACFALAGSLGSEPGALSERLLGDGLVRVSSALGQHRQPARALAFAPERQFTAQGVDHLGLLDNATVHDQLRRWLL